MRLRSRDTFQREREMYRLATVNSVADQRRDGQTDDIILPIPDHVAYNTGSTKMLSLIVLAKLRTDLSLGRLPDPS